MKRSTSEASDGFTSDERAAMKKRTRELKLGTRRGSRAGKADEEQDALTKIAEMPEPDRRMAERLHVIITASVSILSPKT